MPTLREGEGSDQDSKASTLVGIDGEQVSKKKEKPACLACEDDQTAPLRAVARKNRSFGMSCNGEGALTYAHHPAMGTMQI